MRRFLILVILTILNTFICKLVTAMTPVSYFSIINSQNQINESVLYIFVEDTYCTDDSSVWRVDVDATISAKCYTTIGSASVWEVIIKYNTLPPNSVTLSYNNPPVKDSFPFNPRQFYKYVNFKQIKLLNEKSIFILEPSLIRGIEGIYNGHNIVSVLLQIVNPKLDANYKLEVYNETEKVETFTGDVALLYKLGLTMFIGSKSLDDNVYTFKILEDDVELATFTAFFGRYKVNYYGSSLYIFRNLILRDNKLSIMVRSSSTSPIQINSVKVKLVSNNLQTLLDVYTDTNITLTNGQWAEIPVATIDTTFIDRIKNTNSIMIVEINYIIDEKQKYKKIATVITQKDLIYVTQNNWYYQFVEVNLIYPRPTSTIVTENFGNGTVTIQNAPIIFLFPEVKHGAQLSIISVNVTLHPVNGGSITVNKAEKVEGITAPDGTPIGVFRILVDYNNIKKGLIPIIGTIEIKFKTGTVPPGNPNIHAKTVIAPIEFTINTENLINAINYVNQLEPPIYDDLNTLKKDFKSYDYFWVAYSKDYDNGVLDQFSTYFDIVSETFPVTDLSQNPKVYAEYSTDSISIYFDPQLKEFFNYDNAYLLIMNEDGILKEPMTYTLEDTLINKNPATKATFDLKTTLSMTHSQEYHFMKAYQTNGFVILKHQVYKTIIPFSVFRPFSVYFDENGLTILNKGDTALTYYPDSNDASTYYVIEGESFQSNLPIGASPLIIYNNVNYYINPNYNFNPRIVNENVYIPLVSVNNPDILLYFTVSDVETKKLYDLGILQLFPLRYKDFLLRADTFYTYSLINNPITSITCDSKTVSVSKLQEYYLYSYLITEYQLSNQLYDDDISLTLENIKNTQLLITYSDSSSRTTPLLLFNIVKRDFMSDVEKSPTLYNSPVFTIVSYYDPRLSSPNFIFNFNINNTPVQPHAIVRSPKYITMYYAGTLSGDVRVSINNEKLILILP